MGLTPGDPTLWSAALFVRDGPYAPAVLRFHISFPNAYPRLPPAVTFSTDIFHPLITPLTTYMHTTDIQDDGTVSATDEERLPPGGFSLRHGFPEWFGRSKRSNATQESPEQKQTPAMSTGRLGASTMITPERANAATASYAQTVSSYISAYNILKYIRSVFDDEEVLDTVPLDAAGNPGAWHAWRAHRTKLGKLLEAGPMSTEGVEEGQHLDAAPEVPLKGRSQQSMMRNPGQWNWDGVWEDRVKKGIASSLSEGVLYGGAAPLPDELVWLADLLDQLCADHHQIKFLPLEESEVEQVKENIRRALGVQSY